MNKDGNSSSKLLNEKKNNNNNNNKRKKRAWLGQLSFFHPRQGSLQYSQGKPGVGNQGKNYNKMSSHKPKRKKNYTRKGQR